MKTTFFVFLFHIVFIMPLKSQHLVSDKQRKEIESLIDKYSLSRENRDTVLLKNILVNEIDQLVSTGEWRDGLRSSVQGMLKSSAGNPGSRTLKVEKLRLLSASTAIVDCKYEIKNSNGTPRKMWSTFIVVSDNGTWKISAIRNMLPTTP